MRENRLRGRILEEMSTMSARGPRHLASSPFAPKVEVPIVQYALEDRISHDTYGLGRVIGVEPHAVLVDFGSQKVRVTSPYARMELL
jgi:hypothetical protein